ncbi:MAG: hypothetical protein ABJE95_15740 [Byssovorax sp.]
MSNSGSQSLGCGLLAMAAGLGLAACAAESADVPLADPAAHVAPEGLWVNGLDADMLTQNALIANPVANPKMPTVPLTTASYSDASIYPELRNQLREPAARQVMRYVVSCALSPSQNVSYHHTSVAPTPDIDQSWDGEVGLCPGWASGPASVQCQELVSACVLARVNALDKHVEVSMRGQTATGGTIPLGATVAALTTDLDNHPVDSFQDCAVATTGSARNCGYKTNLVGTCVVGDDVCVGAGGPADPVCGGTGTLGSSTDGTVLRVCDAIIGCNSSAALGESSSASSSTKPSTVRFKCPASGTFNVMSGPLTSGGPGLVSPAANGPTAVSYPATEKASFSWQEGAFYGNLWAGLSNLIHVGDNQVDSAGVFHPAAPISNFAGSAVFVQMYACAGIYWTKEDARMKSRLCADPGAGTTVPPTNCAAVSAGACSTSVTMFGSPLMCPRTNVCIPVYGSSGGTLSVADYDNCGGGGHTWLNPITVYLNQPGDTVSGVNSGVSGSPSAPPAPLCP